MDPRERIARLDIATTVAIEGRLTEVWTAMPGIIQSYDPTTMTAQVQVTITPLWTNPLTQKREPLPIPPISDCPVEFPGGGGFHLIFPVKKGDECTMMFSSRMIDGWFATGKVSVQSDLRMHDLSDAFVRVGVRSLPNVLTDLSSTDVQLRNDSGTSIFSIDNSGNVTVTTDSGNIAVQSTLGNIDIQAGIITLQAAASIAINAPSVTVNGVPI